MRRGRLYGPVHRRRHRRDEKAEPVHLEHRRRLRTRVSGLGRSHREKRDDGQHGSEGSAGDHRKAVCGGHGLYGGPFRAELERPEGAAEGRTGDRRRLPRRFLPDRVDVPQPEGKSAVRILRRCPENPEGSRHGPVHRRRDPSGLQRGFSRRRAGPGPDRRRGTSEARPRSGRSGHDRRSGPRSAQSDRDDDAAAEAAVPQRPLLYPRLPRHRRRAGL